MAYNLCIMGGLTRESLLRAFLVCNFDITHDLNDLTRLRRLDIVIGSSRLCTIHKLGFWIVKIE